jgi:hypothetical protein
MEKKQTIFKNKKKEKIDKLYVINRQYPEKNK